ncbi:MAG: hypothetical protein KIT22_18070 [Verrucomicrobiae bacterium]|nr:hypothetical protein [Verrucomicrobiae bacterium]
MSPAPALEQGMLPLWIPTVTIPQGDGSVVVKPGKPVAWLTPKQFGQQFGLSADTICRRIGHESLPESFVEYAGPRKIRIQAAALDHFRAHWRKHRDAGA